MHTIFALSPPNPPTTRRPNAPIGPTGPTIFHEPHKAPGGSLSCIVCVTRMTACTLTPSRVIGGKTSYENEPNRNLVLLVFLLLRWVGTFAANHMAPPPAASLPTLSILVSYTCLALCRLTHPVEKGTFSFHRWEFLVGFFCPPHSK